MTGIHSRASLLGNPLYYSNQLLLEPWSCITTADVAHSIRPHTPMRGVPSPSLYSQLMTLMISYALCSICSPAWATVCAYVTALNYIRLRLSGLVPFASADFVLPVWQSFVATLHACTSPYSLERSLNGALGPPFTRCAVPQNTSIMCGGVFSRAFLSSIMVIIGRLRYVSSPC